MLYRGGVNGFNHRVGDGGRSSVGAYFRRGKRIEHSMILRRSPIKRGRPVKKVRSKPRAGRLKGAALEKLRRECFERDGYRCQAWEMGVVGWFRVEFPSHRESIPIFGLRRCRKSVTWESGHMAHIKAKRRNGDSLDNVRTLCAECHGLEHAYGPSGIKPCPPKERVDVPSRNL
jgi:5-methylcytosine-specific restriction endonuclease McrA